MPSDLSNYNKQIISLSAAFENKKSTVDFFRSLLLIPEKNNWRDWVDGHGFKLSISEKQSIHRSKSKIIFSSDPFFHASFQEIIARTIKNIWILTDEDKILFFSLDREKIFRSSLILESFTSPLAPLFFGYQRSLEVYNFLCGNSHPMPSWKFISPFGKMTDFFWDLTEPPRMLMNFSSLSTNG